MSGNLRTEYLKNLKKEKFNKKKQSRNELCTKKDLTRIDLKKLINENYRELTKNGKIKIKIKDLNEYINDQKPWTKSKATTLFIKKYIPEYGVLLDFENYKGLPTVIKNEKHFEDCLTIKIPRIHPYIIRTLCAIVTIIMIGILTTGRLS